MERPIIFDRYVHAVEQEIERLPKFYAAGGMGRELFALPVDTVYVGGGTPSLLGMERLERIAQALGRQWKFAPPLEFTLEVTPGSGDADFLARARRVGINRLSIGAQTFDDRELRAVGRLHRAADTCELVHLARRAGFENVGLDLIAGLPHQTETSWSNTLRAALRLRPEHLSLYLLEIDEKSRLGGEVVRHGLRYHAPAVPSEEFTAQAYEAGRELLAREGYAQYEISNFALPGYESRHNRKYWQLAPYVGLGAGAHSLDGEHRWANETDPGAYQERLAAEVSPITEVRRLSPAEQIEEFFFLGLRQCQGVDLSLAAERWGRESLECWQEKIARLSREGWLQKTGNRVHLTKQAYLVSNEIFEEFVSV